MSVTSPITSACARSSATTWLWRCRAPTTAVLPVPCLTSTRKSSRRALRHPSRPSSLGLPWRLCCSLCSPDPASCLDRDLPDRDRIVCDIRDRTDQQRVQSPAGRGERSCAPGTPTAPTGKSTTAEARALSMKRWTKRSRRSPHHSRALPRTRAVSGRSRSSTPC